MVLVVIVVRSGVLLENLEKVDHLAVDLPCSGGIARIAGLVDRIELRHKVLRGEVDLPERAHAVGP